MNNCPREYLDIYGIPKKETIRLINQLQGSSLHIFGASGALGLSLLSLLNIYKISVDSLTLYIRKESNILQWEIYAKKNKIKILNVYIEDEFRNLDLGKINASSTVLYFLGYGQPRRFLENPGALFKINIELLTKVVETAPKYIFYASTSEIYTGITKVATEDSSTSSTPQHSRGAYIESKRCGEAILANMSNATTRSVAFRIALATPPMPMIGDTRILADLANMAKEDGFVCLKGGWQSIRQYQWGPVCMQKLLWAGFFGRHILYNISGGEKIKLTYLAKSIADFYGVKYIENNDQILDIGAPELVNVSIARLEKELGAKFPDEPFKKMLEIYLNKKNEIC